MRMQDDYRVMAKRAGLRMHGDSVTDTTTKLAKLAGHLATYLNIGMVIVLNEAHCRSIN